MVKVHSCCASQSSINTDQTYTKPNPFLLSSLIQISKLLCWPKMFPPILYASWPGPSKCLAIPTSGQSRNFLVTKVWIVLIKKEKTDNSIPEKGVKAFYVSKYDPRMPHPRKLISRNYHHIASNPDLAALFPRENLIGGTKRDRNLGEMLSPTDH